MGTIEEIQLRLVIRLVRDLNKFTNQGLLRKYGTEGMGVIKKYATGNWLETLNQALDRKGIKI